MSIPNITKQNIDDKNNTDPITCGMSLERIALIISVPSPGIAKIDSMITVPPSKEPKDMPSVVTIGQEAFLNACKTTIINSFNPLERAVRI